MDISALWDPASAAIVLGGTLLATMLRAGVSDLAATARVMAWLTKPRFDYAAARSEIAAQVEDIRHNGVLRAQPSHSSDSEISDATDALINRRSISAAIAAHERHRQMREDLHMRALRTIYCAGELAPVFGLAGTLLALSQLPISGLERDSLMGAVAIAVVSTLYGLLAAHLLLMPLARWVERAGEAEETARQHLIDWMAAQLATACPDTGVGRPGNLAAVP